ncbi:MAG TPA: hypothetical protein VHC69_25435 [Polyangiaceae bacterium]|nr:hypothetical protein [Polyangiaceae bacterium]
MSLRISFWLVPCALAVTACAPDVAAPGYDDPFLTNVAGATGSAVSPSMSADAGGAALASAPAAPAPTPATTMTVAGAAPAAPASSAPAPMSGATTSSGASDPNCDLSGRWLVTQRTVEEGLGVQQALRQWMYFEFTQNGTQATVTRGLDCGWDVVPLSAIAGSADLHKAWPKITANNPMAGRKGTIKTSSGGCSVSFAPYVSVYGATVSYYKDTSHALPDPNTEASGATPGWEDWDDDGNPGITYNLSGIASGQVFYSTRMTNTWSGTIDGTRSSFTIADAPKHENDELGYNGSPLLTTQSQLSADASLHFVQFARLDSTEATGDDTATCNAARTLATTLTPKADEKPVQ